jgi:hypothetical protein
VCLRHWTPYIRQLGCKRKRPAWPGVSITADV